MADASGARRDVANGPSPAKHFLDYKISEALATVLCTDVVDRAQMESRSTAPLHSPPPPKGQSTRREQLARKTLAENTGYHFRDGNQHNRHLYLTVHFGIVLKMF